MKYKILRTDGDWDFHNNGTITELPEGAILLTDEEWENRLNIPLNTEQKKVLLNRNLISSRLAYLFSTDWYALREIDEPNSYPEEIKNKRIQARQEINAIEKINTLTGLNKYKLEFN